MKIIGGREILEDGEVLTHPLRLMDGKTNAVPLMHKPGPVTLTDEQKAEKVKHLNGYEQTLTSRWKNPPQVLPEHLNAPAAIKPAAPAATPDAAYKNYDEKISQRWKGAA